MIAFKSPVTRSIGAAIALTFVAGVGSYSLGLGAFAQTGKDAPSQLSKEQLSHATALSEAFKQVTKSLAPSVVNIRSTEKFNRTAANSDQGADEDGEALSPDDEFLRRFFGNRGQGAPNQPRQQVGEGTGVITREDGYIITNNHVVSGATEIRVKLDDDREYPATVVGTDAESDLAVIKIDATGLSPAKFGDSDKLDQGEWVLAMGCPFGLQHTVTAGIVSAKGRANMGLATFEDYIQTDAAINPGNSGGPLVNIQGEVVGINSAISTRSGGYQGVGFAIPSNNVKVVTNSIIANGKVKRGWLGVEMHPLDKALAQSFGATDANGVLIARVLPNGPAQTAGLRKGDIVVRINNKAVNNTTQLLNTIGQLTPGDKAKLEVLRQGKPQDVTVTLADRSEQQLSRAGGEERSTLQPRESIKPAATLGMTLQPLTRQIARQLRLETGTQGAVVAEVEADSLAAKAGIQPGDLITAVGDAAVTGVDDAGAALDAADLAKGVRLELISSGRTKFAVIKNDDQP